MPEVPPSSVGRVVVGVSGSFGCLHALAVAADEARRRGAELWPVLAWRPPGGELTARRSPGSGLLDEEWRRIAAERLSGALDGVLGGVGRTGEIGAAGREPLLHPVLVRGDPGTALVAVADREGDVLVIGTGRRGPLRRGLRPRRWAATASPTRAAPYSPSHRHPC